MRVVGETAGWGGGAYNAAKVPRVQWFPGRGAILLRERCWVNAVTVLVHSPLVGPLTWAPVSRILRQRGVGTVVPVLSDEGDEAVPFWTQHTVSVARRLEPLAAGGSVLLVGHSGAGALLPAIGAFSPQPVAGYIFVDAGLPRGGMSRQEDMEAEAPELAASLRAHLVEGGRFPEWSDEDLREVIPDAGLRAGVLAELRPRPLAFFEERIPAFDVWPDAPCAYIRLSAAYEKPAEEARQRGWPYRAIEAGHFHMLVNPEAVAGALLASMEAMKAEPVGG